MLHDEYTDRRNELLTIQNDSFESFDKTILALATGALALSIAFLDKVGTPFNLITLTLLSLAWAALVLALVFNLVSFQFAILNASRAIDELDERYKKWLLTKRPETNAVKKESWQNRATKTCNGASLSFFILGVSFFMFYAFFIQMHKYQSLIGN